MTTIARALTTRVRRATSNEEPAQQIPTRAGTLKNRDYRSVDRAKISLPTQLLSTTNALAYDAPDLPKVNTIISPSTSSAASSRRSFDGSESGASSATSISTPTFSREGSPVLGSEQLKAYFAATQHFLDSPVAMAPLSPKFQEIEIPPTTPAVPSRAVSHTKKTHQALASKRSQSRLSSEYPSRSRSGSGELAQVPEHPFGAELAQVKEVAEEFGVRDVRIWDEEERFLVESGYGRFSAEDYMSEIQPLFGKAFYEPHLISNTPMWL